MNRILPLAIAMLLLTGVRAIAEPGNTTRGEWMYRACVACHSLEPNRNMTGPSLAEIWNRKAGSLASFPRYSSALRSSGIIWTDDTLDEWQFFVESPGCFSQSDDWDLSVHGSYLVSDDRPDF